MSNLNDPHFTHKPLHTGNAIVTEPVATPMHYKETPITSTRIRVRLFEGTKNYAITLGLSLSILSLVSLFIPGSQSGLTPLLIEDSYGLFLGFLTMNIVTKISFFTLGVLGVLCSVKNKSATAWSWIMAGVMIPLSIMGMYQATTTLYGFAPLYGYHILVSGVVGVLSLMFALLGSRAKEVKLVKTYQT